MSIHPSLVSGLLVAFSLSAAAPVVRAEQEQKPDEICRLLFDAYIARGGKISTSTIMAASHIVAERGHDTGFWKIVLKELRKDNGKSKIGCVRVLGKMLAIDARARDIIRTGEVTAWDARVALPPEAVEELIARGKKADAYEVDHYCIALARARVPEARNFLRMILQKDTGKDYSVFSAQSHTAEDYKTPSTQFHAAVGLAHLADAKGFEWLIDNIDDDSSTVFNAWPSRVPDLNLNTCSIAALKELSGETGLNTKKEWRTWWKSVDRSTLPKRPVKLVELL